VRRFLLLSLSATVAATAANEARAQTQPVPPIYYSLDRNGVDLVTGDLNLVTSEVSIGPPGAGGLTYGRVAIETGWRDRAIGGLSCTGDDCVLSLGGQSQAFTKSGFDPPVFTPVSNEGATLEYDAGSYRYSAPGGTIVTLAPVTGANPYNANVALLSEVVEPGGLTTTYHYTTVGVEQRLQSITNTLGYQIHYRYDAVTPTVVDKVMGINMAQAYCAPTAPNCDGLSGWPSISYSLQPDGSGGVNEYATDQSNRTTLYHRDPTQRIDRVQLPGQIGLQVGVLRDGAGRVTRAEGPHGVWNYAYTVTSPDLITVATGPSGEETLAFTNEAVGRPHQVRQLVATSPTTEVREYNFTYDGQNRLTGIEQPEGDRVTYTLDARGNATQTVWTSKDGLSTITTSATYPTTCSSPVICNRPVSTTDGRGAVTDYSWDPTHGGLLAMTEPAPTAGALRPQTRYSYGPRYAWYRNSSGVVVQAPSPVTVPTAVSACITGNVAGGCAGTADEVVTVMTYETSGAATNLQPISISTGAATGSLRPTQTLTYTEDGDVATVSGPVSGDSTTYVYDPARQLVGVMSADPDGGGVGLNRAQRLSYSPRGQITLVEAGTTVGQAPGDFASFNPLERQSVAYDDLGRIVRMRRETAGGTPEALQQVTYDASGRPVCTTCTLSAQGAFGPDRVATTIYNRLDQPTSVTTANGTTAAQTETVTYTLNGLPQTLTDGRGNVSRMEYDGFDRVARLRYPDPISGQPSTTDDELYGYDANGNVTAVTTRANQTFTTTYDALNRPTAVAAPSPTPSTALTYDNLGRTLTASIPGLATTMTWDALGRLLTETGPTGTMSYAYDLAGRRTGQTWPDGFTVGWDYNVLGEMTVINRPAGAIIGYVYDNLGRRIAMNRANGAFSIYAYDGVSRLTGLTHHGAANVALTYTHNPAGQIVTRTLSNPAYAYATPPGGVTYSLDRQNRIASANGTGFSYDANGNLTADGARTYVYDASSRLIGGGSPAGSLSYDALGRLDLLTGTYGGRYVYDGVEAVALANASTNAIENHFIRGPGVDEIVANYPTATPNAPLFWHLDERNSLMATTNAAAGVAFVNGYDDQGQPRPGNLGRFQYTGQLLMPDFGAYHYKARAYAPGLGRFLQTDPLGYAAGANLYGYVGGDPVNWTDPLGLCPGGSYEIARGPNSDVGDILCYGQVPTLRDRDASTIGNFNSGSGGLAGLLSSGPGGHPYAQYFGNSLNDSVGPPIESDPSNALYNARRDAAFVRNEIYGEWVTWFIPAAPVIRAGRAASLAARVCQCFEAGTEVWTEDGLRDIEDLAIGDRVLARDEATGETVYRPIVELIRNQDRPIWEVTVELDDGTREIIATTDEHPWRTTDGRWVETDDLALGFELVTAEGAPVQVVSVLATNRVASTYNFEVEDFHTYFVGEAGVWVHNRCGETIWTAFGRLQHRLFAQRVLAKPGWRSETLFRGTSGGYLRPDAVTARGRIIELKPNTPSGRRSGAAQLQRYREELGMNGRVIYY